MCKRFLKPRVHALRAWALRAVGLFECRGAWRGRAGRFFFMSGALAFIWRAGGVRLRCVSRGSGSCRGMYRNSGRAVLAGGVFWQAHTARAGFWRMFGCSMHSAFWQFCAVLAHASPRGSGVSCGLLRGRCLHGCGCSARFINKKARLLRACVGSFALFWHMQARAVLALLCKQLALRGRLLVRCRRVCQFVKVGVVCAYHVAKRHKVGNKHGACQSHFVASITVANSARIREQA